MAWLVKACTPNSGMYLSRLAGSGAPRCGIHASFVYNTERRVWPMTLIAPRIAVDRLARFGKPVIEGVRVPVSIIFGAVSAGDSWEEIPRT